jgi:hypothetical protein
LILDVDAELAIRAAVQTKYGGLEVSEAKRLKALEDHLSFEK